jgi:hypothetical protein
MSEHIRVKTKHVEGLVAESEQSSPAKGVRHRSSMFLLPVLTFPALFCFPWSACRGSQNTPRIRRLREDMVHALSGSMEG